MMELSSMPLPVGAKKPSECSSTVPPLKKALQEQALLLIHNRNLRELDPTVGDTACHLRARLLVHIAKRSSDQLPKRDLRFLADTMILMCNKESKTDPMGFLLIDRSKDSILPDPYRVDFNAKERKAIVEKSRQNLAQEGIISLKNGLDVLKGGFNPLPIFASLEEAFSESHSVERSGKPLPVLPLYASIRTILMEMVALKIPLIINIVRFLQSEEGSSLIPTKALSLLYEVDEERGNFRYQPDPSPTRLQEPALSFNCYSIMPLRNVSPSSIVKDGEEFQEHFVTLDIAQMILLAAAAHSQFPTREAASYDKITTPLSIDKIDFSSQLHLLKEEQDLAEEYGALRKIADLLGIVNQRYARKENSKIVRTESAIPFLVDHVFASCYESELQQQQLLAHRCGRRLKLVEDIS